MPEPNDKDAALHRRRGVELAADGKLDEAIDEFRLAIRLNPRDPMLYDDLAAVLGRRGRLEDAVAAIRTGIRIDPTIPALHNRLCLALQIGGDLDAAMDAAANAITLDPANAEYHFTYGYALELAGEIPHALQEFRQTLRLDPQHVKAVDSIAFLSNFDPALEPSQILAAATDWSRRFEHPGATLAPHTNSPVAHRRLKIGYVSPMFYNHAESHFVLPLLESHDRALFEIHCFCNGAVHDAITTRLRRSVDAWYEIQSMDDDDAVKLVRDAGIDILVDLAMHLEGNRLGIFAHKPAPVQFTWIAYPGTTGLTSIDYRITDPIIDPPNRAGGYADLYTEKSVRLRTSWCSYSPLSTTPARGVAPSPHIRFGSLNNPIKLNDSIVGVWARVLAAVADSRMTIGSYAPRQRNRILQLLANEGIAKERVTFVNSVNRERYLRRYEQIDIALDTLPYNGITTSCDALWMGVPVITLKGKTAPGRAGASLLAAAGLGEFIAETESQFVEIARSLAADFVRLQSLHSTLRRQVECSALMNWQSFAREMEAAYRTAWIAWCAARAAC
jgi:predicted O-linked N-acetylglucosamine transferase (SPINDLY family)